MWTPKRQSPHSLRRTENNRLVSHTHDIVETHGYAQEYRWTHVSAFKQGNIATVGLFRMAETSRTNALATRTFSKKYIQEKVEVRKTNPNRLYFLHHADLCHILPSLPSHMSSRGEILGHHGRKLRDRGEVDLRTTCSLRGKLLTRPPAQVMWWTQAHSTSQQ